MRFLSYKTEGTIRSGVLLTDQRVLDLKLAAKSADIERASELDSVLSIVRAGDKALENVQRLIDQQPDEACLELAQLSLTAPLPIPEQIRDFANYEGHCLGALDASMRLRTSKEEDPKAAYELLKNSGTYRIPPIWYEIPLYYKGNRFSASGHGEDVIWPPFAENLDYEIEVAAVIGSHAKDVSVENARDHIFGYTVFNDFSARDVQARWEGQFRMGPAKGKDFDTGNSFGPYLVTKDEIPNPYSLEMIVRVNGEERCRGTSGGSQHNFEQCIAQVSRSETLHPGEILALGTIENGCGFESLTWLSPDDVVELEIEGIGILRNRVVREQTS